MEQSESSQSGVASVRAVGPAYCAAKYRRARPADSSPGVAHATTSAMGHVYQRVELAAVHEEELTILVDTGATYSLIAPALADRLGVVRFPRKQTIGQARSHARHAVQISRSTSRMPR